MNGFVRKKVQSSTLGERLRQYRLDRRISLNEASKNTKIQVRYLECLESGDYDGLPADVYSKGFLRNYAEYLGINPEKAVALFEKEKGIRRNIRRESDDDQKVKKVKVSRFIVTPKMIGTLAVFAVVFLAFFYLYSEFDNFVSTPRLIIKRPLLTHETINDSHVYFEGITDKDNEVMINGKRVMVNDQGAFASDVSLQRGVNVITVKAVNRFEKETKKEFVINSEIETPNEEEEVIKKSFELEISAVDIPVNVSVFDGEEKIYSGVVYPEFSQKIRVNNNFSISSDSGINTEILIDGEDKGFLSEEQGEVEKISFDVE